MKIMQLTIICCKLNAVENANCCQQFNEKLNMKKGEQKLPFWILLTFSIIPVFGFDYLNYLLTLRLFILCKFIGYKYFMQEKRKTKRTQSFHILIRIFFLLPKKLICYVTHVFRVFFPLQFNTKTHFA